MAREDRLQFMARVSHSKMFALLRLNCVPVAFFEATGQITPPMNLVLRQCSPRRRCTCSRKPHCICGSPAQSSQSPRRLSNPGETCVQRGRKFGSTLGGNGFGNPAQGWLSWRCDNTTDSTHSVPCCPVRSTTSVIRSETLAAHKRGLFSCSIEGNNVTSSRLDSAFSV